MPTHDAWKTFNETRRTPKRRRGHRMGHGRITINDEKLWLAAQAAGFEPGSPKTGEDAFARFHKCTWKFHPQAKVCPGCGESCSVVAIVDLVYAHIVCECRNGPANYDHLVEQLWHIRCFVPQEYARRLNEASVYSQGTDAT